MSIVSSDCYCKIQERARTLQVGCFPIFTVSGYMYAALGMNLKVEMQVQDLARKTGKAAERIRRLAQARGLKFTNLNVLKMRRSLGLVALVSFTGLLGTEAVIGWAVKQKKLSMAKKS